MGQLETFNSQARLYQPTLDKDDKGKVANYYNALSQSYDELYGEEQGLKNRLVGDLLKAIRFRRALDIGCGTGAFLQAYPHYQEAVGIDLSREMLRKAQEKKIRNVELIVGDASALPIRDGIADLIISISLAEAGSTLPRMLGELERVAEKQSTIALSIFNQQGYSLDPPSLTIQSTTKVSDRENLYLIRLNPGGKREPSRRLAGAL